MVYESMHLQLKCHLTYLKINKNSPNRSSPCVRSQNIRTPLKYTSAFSQAIIKACRLRPLNHLNLINH